MDLKRGQQAKDHPGGFDRQLCQLILPVQCSVWRCIDTPTQPDEGDASQKLPKRLTRHTNAGKLMRANHPLRSQKFECLVCSLNSHGCILRKCPNL